MASGGLGTLFDGLRVQVRSFEDWWFDTTRSVKTSGNQKVSKSSTIVGEIRDSFSYFPVRVANGRTALQALPVTNHAEYTFIDIGSGKGRMLFVAAELPFRKVLGVEFATDLHEQALVNIKQYNHRKQRCSHLESANADAAQFEFPSGNLVIYLFNPFGPDVMERMLSNLDRSLEKDPRHVVIVLLWPESAHLVAGMEKMRSYQLTRRHHIYQTVRR
jgi:SAM-dependent methyltransferase